MFRRFSDRGAVTAGSVGTWYQTLHKPSFNPPDWIFGPVWMLLYTMMAIAAWRVWRVVGWSNGVEALSLFATQLALIAAATAAAFRKVDRLAAWLMVPYLVWVAFAAVLNFSIWRLNQAGAGVIVQRRGKL